MPHIYNYAIRNLHDVQECENSCQDSTHSICRSFTYDGAKNLCYLSHLSLSDMYRANDRKETTDNFNGPLVYGELDDCIGCKFLDTVFSDLHQVQ